MSSAPCTAWPAQKLWRSCDAIKETLVQPAFDNFFWSAQPYLINFGSAYILKAKISKWALVRTLKVVQRMGIKK